MSLFVKGCIFFSGWLFFMAVFPAGLVIAEETGGVNWRSYPNGIEEIQSGEKKGFVHFYTDWCTYCRKMDAETFSSEQVVRLLNEHFIPVRVDAEKEVSVARTYGVNQFPTSLFLSADTGVIAGRPGFIAADQMIDILRFIRTGSYKNMTFLDFLEQQ